MANLWHHPHRCRTRWYNDVVLYVALLSSNRQHLRDRNLRPHNLPKNLFRHLGGTNHTNELSQWVFLCMRNVRTKSRETLQEYWRYSCSVSLAPLSMLFIHSAQFSSSVNTLTVKKEQSPRGMNMEVCRALHDTNLQLKTQHSNTTTCK